MQSVAVSPHVKSPSDPAGSGVHCAAAPPGWSLSLSLSVDGGDPGPGRRLRGEGLGPESTSGLSPPPGFRTTAVGCPRPRPPPHTDPFRLPPGGHGRPRGLGRNARSAEERPSRRPPPAPAPPPPRRRRRQRRLRHKAGTRPRLGLAALPHHPGPQPAAAGLRRTLATPPRLPDASSRRVLRASLAFRSRRLSAQYREIRPGNRRARARAPQAPFFVSPPCRSRALTRRRRHLQARHYGGRGLASGERPTPGSLKQGLHGRRARGGAGVRG